MNVKKKISSKDNVSDMHLPMGDALKEIEEAISKLDSLEEFLNCNEKEDE